MPAQVVSSITSQLAGVFAVDDKDDKNTTLLLWRRVVSRSALRPGEHPGHARWSTARRNLITIMTFEPGEVHTGSKPDRFSLVGIQQLQPTGCTPDCYVCYTIRLTCPYGIHVVRSAAGI